MSWTGIKRESSDDVHESQILCLPSHPLNHHPQASTHQKAPIKHRPKHLVSRQCHKYLSVCPIHSRWEQRAELHAGGEKIYALCRGVSSVNKQKMLRSDLADYCMITICQKWMVTGAADWSMRYLWWRLEWLNTNTHSSSTRILRIPSTVAMSSGWLLLLFKDVVGLQLDFRSNFFVPIWLLIPLCSPSWFAQHCLS